MLPDAEFPGLPTASLERVTEAPKWPIQRVRDKKQPAPSSGWDAPGTPPHIPAYHNTTVTDHNYGSTYDNQSGGWDANGGNDWGDAEVGGKWVVSAEEEQEYDTGWGDEQTNGYHESAHEEEARNDYTSAQTQGMLVNPVETVTTVVQ